ncbi:Pyridoxine kinase [Corynebacterium faecale]|uniref:pyridoxal kinase n=1 Tax=Corynebacterium faecale TaxID=1758466 RepID=UPI0025B2B85A|nr:pyridoxal kinase [Corynebacterium faecale]WJY91655.1 Pyridoxine kinase [Corynebacterium faecale]
MARVGQGAPASEAAALQREHRRHAEMNQQPADVLLIGSQVVYGTVGMSAALPVLHREGLQVLAIPTIVLSAMPHYVNCHTAPHDAQWLADTLNDLVVLGLIDEISTVATGYFASADQVEVVAAWLRDIRDTHPHLTVVVDPTIGDSDVGVYTAPGIDVALRDHLVPLATGLVPNAFEFTHLADTPGDAAARARALLGEHGEWVVVTSFALGSEMVTDLIVTRTDIHEVPNPLVDSTAKGAGDVYAAALVAALHKQATLVDAATIAATTVRAGLTARSL